MEEEIKNINANVGDTINTLMILNDFICRHTNTSENKIVYYS